MKITGRKGKIIEMDELTQIYFQEIGRIPLLSQGREKELARKIKSGLRDSREAQEEMAKGNLSRKKEKELARKIKSGLRDSREAQGEMVGSNLRLVVTIAKLYYRPGSSLSFLDLIQEGNAGLIKATEKFDSSKGYRFSTYASWWIRQAITRAVYEKEKIIRMPVHIGEKRDKIKRIEAFYLSHEERLPTLEEIAQEMKLSPKQIEKLSRLAKETVSFENPVNSQEGAGRWLDFFSDKEAVKQDEVADEGALKKAINQVLSSLSPREEDILRKRFGIGEKKDYTLGEVGQKWSITRERVRQIQDRALLRLRHSPRRKKLKEFS